jgi:STE24 endopeptidase
MTVQTILYLILSFITFDFILEFILDYLNLKNQSAPFPQELNGIYKEEKLIQSKEYFKVNANFGFITSTFSFLVTLLIILLGGFGWLDKLVSTFSSNPILQPLIFFGILFIVSDIVNTPFSLYKTFVIEEKFGFNKTTLKIYLGDKIKSYLLTIIIGGLILSIFIWLINLMGTQFWIYFWIVISGFMLLINMFYTSVIVPLFNKLKPLEEGELRTAIEDYSKTVNFPLTNIFVIDGSKRSSKSNAFFSGIGKKKKIVLYDTLITNHSKEELVAVLAHEAGHFKKNHILQGLIASVLQTGLILFILSLFVFNADLSLALGGAQQSLPLNLIAFGILFSPISHITGIFMNIWSRKNEYEADAYAATTYNASALETALKKLSADNLSNLTPHPAYVFFHYSHPPLYQRLNALSRL